VPEAAAGRFVVVSVMDAVCSSLGVVRTAAESVLSLVRAE